ncbi:hypothetical protein CB1_000713005 [Camelus ferus]|nr:hypothetical protein CB1_000713005 [Camelus ferus]
MTGSPSSSRAGLQAALKAPPLEDLCPTYSVAPSPQELGGAVSVLLLPSSGFQHLSAAKFRSSQVNVLTPNVMMSTVAPPRLGDGPCQGGGQLAEDRVLQLSTCDEDALLLP